MVRMLRTALLRTLRATFEGPERAMATRSERVLGKGNMRTDAALGKGDMNIGRGQTIEAFMNQRIRTEEAGYHLQKDNERLGARAPKGPEIPARSTPPAPSMEDKAAAKLADARKIVQEQFAKYENPDLPREYQAEVAKAKARIVASFEKADERMKVALHDDEPPNVALPAATRHQEKGEEKENTKLGPETHFTSSEWVGLVLATCGLTFASMAYTLWQKRQDEAFARQFQKASPAVFRQLQSIGWHDTLAI
mmetsp:Transcript_59447/g.87163  ORF Transcript_59447/g.87163 Transcript_59447/m.87163 type:complete len:252 (+) Transcript_59447:3-758(+)